MIKEAFQYSSNITFIDELEQPSQFSALQESLLCCEKQTSKDIQNDGSFNNSFDIDFKEINTEILNKLQEENLRDSKFTLIIRPQ